MRTRVRWPLELAYYQRQVFVALGAARLSAVQQQTIVSIQDRHGASAAVTVPRLERCLLWVHVREAAGRHVEHVGHFHGVTVEAVLACMHAARAQDPVAALDLPGEARGLALGGGRAYVWYSAEPRGAFGMQVIDVADPSRPSVVATWEPSSCRNGLAVVDTRVLCTWAAKESSGGLWVIDAADLEQPQPARSYPAPGLAFGFAVEGARAYVVWTTGGHSSPAAPGGLAIVDVSDPAHPQQSGAVQAGPTLDVAVRDGYAFLGTDYRGRR